VVINVGFSVAQVVSAAATSTAMAVALYMVVLVYSLLLGGFIVGKDELPSPMQWAVYTSYFFFGFEALTINEFADKPYGAGVLEGFGFQNGNKYLDLGVLCGAWIVLRIIAYLLLRFLHRQKL